MSHSSAFVRAHPSFFVNSCAHGLLGPEAQRPFFAVMADVRTFMICVDRVQDFAPQNTTTHLQSLWDVCSYFLWDINVSLMYICF
jgi:hypothetical protein